jgi:hypothetical protein
VLNKEIATKWVAALRSGDYKQTQGVLRSADNGYCCLGVLCDLYNKETGNGEWASETIKTSVHGAAYPFLANPETEPAAEFPTPEVLNWAGLECKPYKGVSDLFDTPFATDLAGENDDGSDFERIATLIEAQMKEEEKTNASAQ